jgi:hypothetical protein
MQANSFERVLISPSLRSIHGHHPVLGSSIFDWVKRQVNYPRRCSEDTKSDDNLACDNAVGKGIYKLVRVPYSYRVSPLPTSCPRTKCDLEISCNYSFIKASAAIIQILYGSYELYGATVRTDQIERLGYAAYSLTVIPYMLMSFLNCLASLSQPSYPVCTLSITLENSNKIVMEMWLRRYLGQHPNVRKAAMKADTRPREWQLIIKVFPNGNIIV